jgi:hypothetical protein
MQHADLEVGNRGEGERGRGKMHEQHGVSFPQFERSLVHE